MAVSKFNYLPGKHNLINRDDARPEERLTTAQVRPKRPLHIETKVVSCNGFRGETRKHESSVIIAERALMYAEPFWYGF
jgi:hypothetical protein